ncbi:reactive intermediate/imine deaminase [bacterium]|jgi:2-iminobutanoate/2-iminopropanoate deaminase|nr:reactive intermediate/imine deaminase [bacterium]MBT6832156.1 reactive intermediate/imine deaminase [bacterium]MBT6996398.1 reactive intermediate/imine deaminase [bacterium]MBT7772133.1 reactive intermediate/imine deaminase [bacterium]
MQIIKTKDAPDLLEKGFPLSQATVSRNGMVFISGQLPIDPATGKLVEGGILEQTEQVMRNLNAILKAAGCTFDDVLKADCWVRDLAKNGKAFNVSYKSLFPNNYPAREMCGGAEIAMGALVEVALIVEVPE